MRRPKGLRTTDGVTIKRKTERHGFRARQRYKKPFQRPFLPYLFPQEGKDMAAGGIPPPFGSLNSTRGGPPPRRRCRADARGYYPAP